MCRGWKVARTVKGTKATLMQSVLRHIYRKLFISSLLSAGQLEVIHKMQLDVDDVTVGMSSVKI